MIDELSIKERLYSQITKELDDINYQIRKAEVKSNEWIVKRHYWINKHNAFIDTIKRLQTEIKELEGEKA